MARSLEQNMGPEALRAATGRDHEEWRAVLDAAGARDWDHAATARWLVDAHGVSGWWAQGITVDYEQARKGRLPGQRADGTFSVQRTRTIPGERAEALAAVVAVLTAELGEPHGASPAAAMPNVRWRRPDGTRLAAAAGLPNSSGTPVTITHERVPDQAAAVAAKAAITAWLDRA